MSSSNSLIGIEADSNDRELSPYVPRDDSVPVLPSQEESPGSICRNSSEEEKTEAVVPADVNESLAYSREQCDYLYEFSETRKVLEEFFHPESRRSSHHLGAGTSPDFDELDYTLKRQNGNSYVGQRLAGEVYVVEESPKKPRRGGREVVMSLGIPSELDEGSEFGTSPRLITFHDVSRSSLSLASKSSQPDEGNRDVNDNDLDVETTSTNTETDLGETEIGHQVRHPRNYTLSPETTDCDSNELESEMSLDYEVSIHSSSRLGTTMPVLEDGLSSGNVSENDEEPVSSKHGTGEAGSGYDSSSVGLNPTLLLMKKQITEIEKEIQMRAAVTNQQATNNGGISTSFPGEPSTFLPSSTSFEPSHGESLNESSANANIKVHEVPLCDRRSNSSSLFDSNDPELEALDPMRPTPPPSPAPASGCQAQLHNLSSSTTPLRPTVTSIITQAISPGKVSSLSGTANGIHLSIPGTESKESISTHHTEPLKLISSIMTPPDSKEPVHRHKLYPLPKFDSSSFTSLLPKPTSLNMTTGNLCPSQDNSPQSELHESSSEERLGPQGSNMSPVWVPRRPLLRGDRNHHSNSSGFGLREPFLRKRYEEIPDDDADTDQETDRLLGQHRTEDDYGFYNEKEWKKTKLRSVLPSSATAAAAKGVASFIKPTSHVPVSLPSTNNHSSSSTISNASVVPKHLSLNSPTAESTFSELPLSLPSTKPQKEKEGMKKKRNKEVLIEGVLFRARYLGSTQLISEGQPTKATRMLQAEEAVSRIKSMAPEGETQPSTEVDLFISTEKIMVLNTDLKEIMMDHALRTISYIADIGDLVVLMARRRPVPTDTPEELSKIHRPPKMICHVFESDEAQYIAQSIGQAFQVAYMEFLKANGIEDHSFVREMDYQEVLNSQEIFGDELQMFAKKELQKDVVVPKAKGEILGVVIVESGWGSMLPTVVIANLAPAGAAARCGQLNIGDQIIAINGVSLVGLPLSTCQTYIKNSKTQTVVKLTVVPCPPVVEVKIKRPDTKYQLGFSVQNGVICSLLRGGIAERGGVRVGHRIIEINNQSVVAVPHEKIVNLLATSVGEINMKTMPTSMFRLLTGQETPIYI